MLDRHTLWASAVPTDLGNERRRRSHPKSQFGTRRVAEIKCPTGNYIIRINVYMKCNFATCFLPSQGLELPSDGVASLYWLQFPCNHQPTNQPTITTAAACPVLWPESDIILINGRVPDCGQLNTSLAYGHNWLATTPFDYRLLLPLSGGWVDLIFT